MDNNRYDISKDATGRTVRIDKKTGEIAVVEGNQVQVLKDPKKLATEQESQKELAKPRLWDDVDIPNLNAKFSLTTAWRDGEMFYTVAIYHLGYGNAALGVYLAKEDEEKKKAQAKLAGYTKEIVSSQLESAARHTPFTVQLYDENMTKLREIAVARLTRIVDDKGFSSSFQNQSSIPLSAELYTQLKTFSVQWSGR